MATQWTLWPLEIWPMVKIPKVFHSRRGGEKGVKEGEDKVTHRGQCGGKGCPGWSAAARGPPSPSGSAGWGSCAGPCLSRPLEEHKGQEWVIRIRPPPSNQSLWHERPQKNPAELKKWLEEKQPTLALIRNGDSLMCLWIIQIEIAWLTLFSVQFPNFKSKQRKLKTLQQQMTQKSLNTTVNNLNSLNPYKQTQPTLMNTLCPL